MILLYKHTGKLMSRITADYKNQKVSVENFDDNPMDLAFGINTNPSFKDFEDLLELRCFPRNRDMMKLHLKELDLDYYDPLSIIMKTKGRLAGDDYELEVVEP